jgi:hypothetical protein
LLRVELWCDGSNITRVFLKSDTKAAINKNSATPHVQEDAKISLIGQVSNVASNAREIPRVVLKRNATNSGATMKYGFVLSARSVGESVRVLEAPLELIAECVHAVLDVKRLLDK